jgi:hypothetical protein
VNGTTVRVLVSHFGNTEDTEDLRLQTEMLINAVQERKGHHPTMFIGYLTTDPYDPRYLQIIESGLRDTVTSLDRYCLYLLYKDMKLEKFFRVDKGNISDTEAQVAFLTLLPENKLQKPTPASAEYCRGFVDDSVGCQASHSCGWCQISHQGFCFEPEQKQGCVDFGGKWVGPHSAPARNKNADQIDREFAGAQHAVSLKSAEPVVKKGDRIFVWEATKFMEAHSFARVWDSPIFEYDNNFWRLSVQFSGSRYRLGERTFWITVKSVTTPHLATANRSNRGFSVSLQNQQNPQKFSASKAGTVAYGSQASANVGQSLQELIDTGYITPNGLLKISLTFNN